jgi:ornithine--oxo-acid transaminase
MLACQHDNVQPDGLVLGKSLGGGLLPVSLFLAKRELMSVFAPGDHGSTFGGSPLACAVGLASLEVLVEEKLCERSARLGAYLLERLRQIQSPLIREIRGRGLWCGVEFDPALASAREVALRLLDAGILTKDTHRTVIRFAPPLIIEREQLDWAIDRFSDVIAAWPVDAEKELAAGVAVSA